MSQKRQPVLAGHESSRVTLELPDTTVRSSLLQFSQPYVLAKYLERLRIPVRGAFLSVYRCVMRDKKQSTLRTQLSRPSRITRPDLLAFLTPLAVPIDHRVGQAAPNGRVDFRSPGGTSTHDLRLRSGGRCTKHSRAAGKTL
jgi:hypothetical protein